MKKLFSALVKQTNEMINKFQDVEQKPWGVEGAMIELSKQVGDLAKMVMVAEKYYLQSRGSNKEYEASPKKIADELFDIWFCIIRIANYYKIDLEESIDKITTIEIENFKQGKIK